MKPTHLKLLESHLNSLRILGSEEIESFISKVKLRKFRKNEYLIKEGEISSELIFVTKGIFRTYFTPSQGSVVTYGFTFENNFLAAYSSFITQKESGENIQAVVNSEAFIIAKDQLEQLANQYPGWTRFLKIYSEQQYLHMERLLKRVYQENAETRYVRLIKNQPHYFQHLPLNHIASYLGITQRHLSRIRKGIMVKEMEDSKNGKKPSSSPN
ncbi:Crp/Fnr family transcriptional regulator [Algoriphagus confluentis]|uniref:Crp/Fnr family transcriptional regulator n=1 Tax=Algoriphagus confluentis TaxID=1697556 RepID=A0ABQ6PWH3_9BACT|nr:Crp/Fnr family transcriptional regulator [Algoriphagus confluentis]